MSDERVQRFADLLIEARCSRRKLTSIPEDLIALSVEEGARVQDEVAGRLSLRVAGWKAGIPPGGEIYNAPLFSAVLRTSPAEIRAADHPFLCVEGEMAFRIGRDLPPRAAAYSRDDVADAIESACVAIEILCWRIPEGVAAPFAHKIADNLGSGALICGAPNASWRPFDRSELQVKLEMNGVTVENRVAAKPAHSTPMVLLTWLANHLSARDGLKAGQVVTTGTWVGTHPAGAGDSARVTFAGLGQAEVALV